MSDFSIVDLRSDTMTKPSASMKKYMCEAPLGDDVWGEDPTVIKFQTELAKLCNKESALLFPAATQANLCAIMSHCDRGDEYIVGNQAHCYRWEAGGAAVLGSVQPNPLPHQPNGSILLESIKKSINPDDPHFARTKLISIENPHWGKVLDLDYMQNIREICDQNNLGFHLDGARAFHATTYLDCPISRFAQHCDTLTLCFSKALGCPFGAALVGSKNLIKKALRLRKLAGGALRQSGMIAAACQYALKNNISDLSQDHKNALLLASGIKKLQNKHIKLISVNTNMVFAELSTEAHGRVQPYAKKQNILLANEKLMRLVTHRDINSTGIERTIQVISEVITEDLQKFPQETMPGLY